MCNTNGERFSIVNLEQVPMSCSLQKGESYNYANWPIYIPKLFQQLKTIQCNKSGTPIIALEQFSIKNLCQKFGQTIAW